jgi:hypothetical protein
MVIERVDDKAELDGRRTVTAAASNENMPRLVPTNVEMVTVNPCATP